MSDAMTPGCLIAYVEGLTGHRINADEGIKYGASGAAGAGRPVRRVLVCWMATPEALREATESGCELVIAHESLYYPYNATDRDDNPAGWDRWPTNAQRRRLLEEGRLTLLRLHGSLDEVCIYDDSAARLGLGAPAHADGLAKVYETAPCTVGELAERVKRAVGMAAVRVCAPGGLEQVVRRIGLPWGGLGLFVNVGYQQRLIDMGVEAMVAGESDNYGFRFAAELGIPTIETGHEVSENPGLERFCAMLRQAFPTLGVRFHECAPIWRML